MSACSSCGLDMEWAMSTVGARLPLDLEVVEREPRPRDVVLDRPSMRGMVLTGTSIASGDAERWLASPRTELRTSHWETCLGAASHREGYVRPGQERLEL